MNENEKIVTEQSVTTNTPVVEEPVQVVNTEPEKPKKNVKKIVVRVIELLIIVVFVVWAYMLYSDYDSVKQSHKPKYCFFGVKTEKQKLGTIEVYKCMGYKVVTYKTEDAKMTEFVPIWQGNRKLEDINK